MELEIEDEFEPEDFYFSIDSAKLPSGEVRKVLDVCYSDGDFEFQGSQPSYSEPNDCKVRLETIFTENQKSP